MTQLSRKDFLFGTAALGAAAAFPSAAKAADGRTEWLAFSRVFQAFGCDRAAALLAEAGYTGVEWTIRPGGFVEPDHAVRDFPKAVAAAAKHGLTCANAIVSFLDPYEGKNLDILKCAADNGVKVFRPAYFQYDFKAKATDDLDRIRRGFDKLEKAARATGLRCLYQNHSTYNKSVALFGSLVWDLWEVLKDRDPRYVGVQYDYMHARAESGPSWQRGLSLLGPWIGTLCLKDFKFAMDAAHPGDWKRVLVPAGEGMLDWAAFKAICERENIRAPYTVHYDYDFPEKDYEAAKACARRDLAFFRNVL